MWPKARGLVQHSSSPGWLEDSDPAGVILYVMEGPYRLPFPYCTCCPDRGWPAQSRQSAKRFSSRWNWDSPTPLAAGECAPPPFGPGGGHTRLRLKGWGSPNFNKRTYTVVLYIYKYVLCAGQCPAASRYNFQLLFNSKCTQPSVMSYVTQGGGGRQGTLKNKTHT
jgi:hypothetical protein